MFSLKENPRYLYSETMSSLFRLSLNLNVYLFPKMNIFLFTGINTNVPFLTPKTYAVKQFLQVCFTFSY